MPVDQPRVAAAVRELLIAIGENPDREGLQETPYRVARAYAEMFEGLDQTASDVLSTTFDIAHDEMVLHGEHISRVSNRSGGTEGGMSTGELLRVRAAMKPIATVPRALRTVDTTTLEPAAAHHQRSDVCAVPAAGVVAEAMVALVLAELMLEKFGGDSLGETSRNHQAYLDRLTARRLA